MAQETACRVNAVCVHETQVLTQSMVSNVVQSMVFDEKHMAIVRHWQAPTKIITSVLAALPSPQVEDIYFNSAGI